MSNSLINPPPIHINFTYNGKSSPGWQRWFTSFHAGVSKFIKSVDGEIAAGGGLPAQPFTGHLLQLTAYTTDQRDAIHTTNLTNGMKIYNSTTHKENLFANGAWEEVSSS